MSSILDRKLAAGARGAEVRFAQSGLNFHLSKLAPLAEDGIFGPKTDARVREFQRRAGLLIDGIIGRLTWLGLLRAGRLSGHVRLKSLNLPQLGGRPFIPFVGGPLFRGRALTGAPPLGDVAGDPPKSPSPSAVPSINLIGFGSSVQIQPLHDEEEHLLTLDIATLAKVDGESPLQLDLKAFAGQPFSAKWKFEAELKWDMLEVPLFGPLDFTLFSKVNFDLGGASVDLGLGGGLSAKILKTTAGKEVLTIGVEAGPKMTIEPLEGKVKSGFDTAGTVEVKFFF